MMVLIDQVDLIGVIVPTPTLLPIDDLIGTRIFSNPGRTRLVDPTY
jgi:hypothetical protein